MKLFRNGNATYCNEKQTGPGACQAPYTVGTGSFSGVKLPRRDVTTNLHVGPRLKKERNCASVPPLCLHNMLWGEILF